jgi:hypothetical protein
MSSTPLCFEVGKAEVGDREGNGCRQGLTCSFSKTMLIEMKQGSAKKIEKLKVVDVGDNVPAVGMEPGSRGWFREIEGLNDYGYVPRVNLPAEIMGKEKVVAMWRKENIHNGF